jgi:ABC-2 type transport system ATP-binding protein
MSDPEGMHQQPTPAALSAVGLRKSFRDKAVLEGIDLNVAEGTIFALLGPNGAGKTTTVQILSTLLAADGGDVRVAGHDVASEPDAVRAAIGVTGQFSAVDDLLTGEENLIDLGLSRVPRGSWTPSCRMPLRTSNGAPLRSNGLSLGLVVRAGGVWDSRSVAAWR